MNHSLYNHPVYKTRAELLHTDDVVRLSYERAKLVARTWDLRLEEIGQCSQRFWYAQRDPVMLQDLGCHSILSCHINLFLGTLAPLLPTRPDLAPIVQRALDFKIIGNFLMSEIGHGLDIMNMETTATKVADGFILNTPNSGASKFMPPTTPISGYPKMAIVMAKLIVDGEERGAHPFLVQTSDAHTMCEGVSSIRLPPRSGSYPLDYAITSFDHVRLPLNAFLGESLDKPKDRYALLHKYTWRVRVGTMALPLSVICGAKVGACIGIDYSLRRHVQGKGQTRVPILSFRTQQLPVLYLTAIAYVLDGWTDVAVNQFMSSDLDERTREGIITIYKMTVCRLVVRYLQEAGERLGAQGTFGHNLMTVMEMESRGAAIAEGDCLVLSIKVFSELLIRRYALPPPTHPETRLSQHSAAIFARCRELLGSFPHGHRDEQYNNLVLPQTESAVLAIGCAFAHSCAMDAGVPQPLLDLFECMAIKLDPSWYSEHAGLTEMVRLREEDRAVQAALPHIRAYANGLNVRKWVSAPIVSDEAWQSWFRQLKAHTGTGAQREYDGEPCGDTVRGIPCTFPAQSAVKQHAVGTDSRARL